MPLVCSSSFLSEVQVHIYRIAESLCHWDVSCLFVGFDVLSSGGLNWTSRTPTLGPTEPDPGRTRMPKKQTKWVWTLSETSVWARKQRRGRDSQDTKETVRNDGFFPHICAGCCWDWSFECPAMKSETKSVVHEFAVLFGLLDPLVMWPRCQAARSPRFGCRWLSSLCSVQSLASAPSEVTSNLLVMALQLDAPRQKKRRRPPGCCRMLAINASHQ